MRKKGQLAIPIITFTIIVIFLLFIAPFMLKIFNSIVNPLQPILGNQSLAAGGAVQKISDTFTTWWDWVIMLVFILNVLIFLVSAFLIDTHPAFALVFLLAGFFNILFAPTVLDAVQKIWDSPQFSLENTQLPITKFLLDHFGAVITGVMFLGGVILYGRIRSGGRSV